MELSLLYGPLLQTVDTLLATATARGGIPSLWEINGKFAAG
jgi:hypothetical protein